MRRILRALRWYRVCLKLERQAKGKPLFEADGVTPQRDRAALYLHYCGTLEGYPPPTGVNERPAHWPDHAT